MKEIVNRLYFTANLREPDLDYLIASLSRLRQAEILAEKHGIRTESECRAMIELPERGRKGLLTMIVYRCNIQK